MRVALVLLALVACKEDPAQQVDLVSEYEHQLPEISWESSAMVAVGAASEIVLRIADADQPVQTVLVGLDIPDLGETQLKNPTTDGEVRFVFVPEQEGPLPFVITALDAGGGTVRFEGTLAATGAAIGLPECIILSPEQGATLLGGEVALFAQPPLERPDAYQATWSSDRDGALAVGFDTEATLSVGLHRVELVVTDSLGRDCSDDVLITVLGEESP